jgi:hypothetical protein
MRRIRQHVKEPIVSRRRSKVRTAETFSSAEKQHVWFVGSERGRSTWFAGTELSAAGVRMSFPLEAAAVRSGGAEYPTSPLSCNAPVLSAYQRPSRPADRSS